MRGQVSVEYLLTAAVAIVVVALLALGIAKYFGFIDSFREYLVKHTGNLGVDILASKMG